MVVASRFLKLHNVWLWSYSNANYGNTLRHWIPGSTNRHTIAMAEKVNYNKNKLKMCIFNDYNNSGSES